MHHCGSIGWTDSRHLTAACVACRNVTLSISLRDIQTRPSARKSLDRLYAIPSKDALRCNLICLCNAEDFSPLLPSFLPSPLLAEGRREMATCRGDGCLPRIPNERQRTPARWKAHTTPPFPSLPSPLITVPHFGDISKPEASYRGSPDCTVQGEKAWTLQEALG